jgi:hypothetical protein
MKKILLLVFLGINGCAITSPDFTFTYKAEEGGEIGVTFNKLLGKNPISE